MTARPPEPITAPVPPAGPNHAPATRPARATTSARRDPPAHPGTSARAITSTRPPEPPRPDDPGRFRISADDLRELAHGNSSAALLEMLAAGRRSKNLALLRTLVQLTAASPAGRVTAEAFLLLRRAEAADPAAVARVLSEPVVGAWLAETVRALTGSSPSPRASTDHLARATTERLALVAAAAGHTAGITVRVGVPIGSDGRIAVPTLGTAGLPSDTGPARFESETGRSSILAGRHRVTLTPGAPGWDAERHLDLSPEQDDSRRTSDWTTGFDPAPWIDLPSAVRRRPRPSDRQLHRVWRVRLAAAADLLARGHPAVADEVRTIVSSVLPIAGRTGVVRSSTFRDAYGLVALSVPTPDPRWTAVTLAHEVQHAKLSALMDLFPLVRPGAAEQFDAPWRPGPRPALNLLHGTYAHLAVTRFWDRQRHLEPADGDRRRAEAQFRRWSSATAGTTLALANSDVLTAAGRQFVGWMHEETQAWT